MSASPVSFAVAIGLGALACVCVLAPKFSDRPAAPTAVAAGVSEVAERVPDRQPLPAPRPSVHPTGCGPVPATLRRAPLSLDGFYQQYCDANGFIIAGSSAVDTRALRVAKSRLDSMTSRLPSDVKNAMIDAGVRFTLMAQSEVTRDIPEFRNMRTPPDRQDVNHTRGWFTSRHGVALSPEENMLCLKDDGYRSSDVFVHEFAHALHRKGLSQVNPHFETRLERIYQAAMTAGRWKGSYAATNRAEYWAVGVQTWYGLNGRKGRYPIRTRAELKYYDVALHNLIAEHVPRQPLLLCPGGRQTAS